MDCIALFRQKHPHVKYELYSGNTHNIKENIERGLIDIGLISQPVDLSKFEIVTMPIEENWGVFVKNDSFLTKKSYIEPQDLCSLSIITSSGDYQSIMFKEWFGQYENQVNIVARGNLMYNASMFVRSNETVLLGICLNYDYKNLTFIPLKPTLKQKTALTWKKEQFFSPATTAFIKFVKDYFKNDR